MNKNGIISTFNEQNSRMVMIERNHLEILRAVERQGSLTAAAEQLHLTQSALSHAMRKLEQQLGTPVWLREGRQLRFTQAGNQLLGLANRLLPQFEHAEMQIRQIAKGHGSWTGCHGSIRRWPLAQQQQQQQQQ